MKIAVNTFVTDESTRPAALAGPVEERGFDAIFVPEHSHIPVHQETPYPLGDTMPRRYFRAVDPFVALTAMAATTRRLIVGTSVALLPQRDVIHTAKEVASLDLVSDGRFVFGVGAGWNREEMRNHGVDPRTRGARLDEQLAALKEIWSREQAEFHGTHVGFDPIFQWPKPTRPRVYVGGNSDAALARAVRHADGWMPNAVRTVESVEIQVDKARQLAGQDFPVTATNAPDDPAIVEAYAAAGIERLSFTLPLGPENRVLHYLDQISKYLNHYR